MGQSASKRLSRRGDQDEQLRVKIKRACRQGHLAPRTPGIDEDHLDEMDECPVCLMFFSALNTTTCCASCICTECYAQVTASKAAEKSSNPCPFCNRAAYTVVFRGRKSVLQRETERSQKLEVEQAMIQARLNEESESQSRRQRRLSADPQSPPAHDEGSLAHEWACAQEAQEAFMAQRVDQYRTILEHHSGDGHMDSSHDIEELMLMQAMLLSLEEPSRPGVSDGRDGSAATGPIAAAAQIAHDQSVDLQLIAAAAADLGAALTAGLEAQAAGSRRTAMEAALEQGGSSSGARETFAGPRSTSVAAARDSGAFASEGGSSQRDGGGDRGGSGLGADDRCGSGSSSHTEVYFNAFASQVACQPVSIDGSQPAPWCQTATAMVTSGRGCPPDAAAARNLSPQDSTASAPAAGRSARANDVFWRYTRQGVQTSLPQAVDSVAVGRPSCQAGTQDARHAVDPISSGGKAGGREGVAGGAALVHHPDGTCQLVLLTHAQDAAASSSSAGTAVSGPPMLELWEGEPFDREVIALIRGGDARLAAAVAPSDSAIVAATLAADVALRDALERRAAEDAFRHSDMAEADRRLAALLLAQDSQLSSHS